MFVGLCKFICISKKIIIYFRLIFEKNIFQKISCSSQKKSYKTSESKNLLKAPKWNWIWQLGNIIENANFINVFPIFGYFFMVLSKGASVYQLQISYEKHDWYKLDINILMALSEGSNGNKFMKAWSRLKGFFGIN